MSQSSSRETNRTLVLASILVGMFMAAIEATIVATAMPDIVTKLGGFSLYSWVFSAFLLSQAATTMLFGKLSDLYGRRPVLVGGISLFLVGSILCGFAWSMPSLILFRFLQGLGAGSIIPVATTIIGDLYTAEERAKVQAYLASVWGISAIIGPLAGALIVQALSWQWIFWMNLPLGVLTVIGLSRYLHEGVEHKSHSINYLGTALFTIAVSSLLLGLTGLGDSSLPLPPVVFFAAFAITFVAFLIQDRKAKEPLLGLDLWADQLIASANGAILVAGMTLMGLTSYLAVYVQGVMGRSATVAGFALTMMAVGWPIASTLSRRFYRRLGMRGTLRLGSVLIVAGSGMLVFLNETSGPVWAGASSMVIGFGMGLLNVTVILMVQGSVGWAKRGSATASTVFSRILGSTIGAAVLGGVLNASLVSRGVSPDRIRDLLQNRHAPEPVLRAALGHALHVTFWWVLGFSAITAVLALFIPKRELATLLGGREEPVPVQE